MNTIGIDRASKEENSCRLFDCGFRPGSVTSAVAESISINFLRGMGDPQMSQT